MCVPAGKQAEVLNILVDDVMEGHPVSEQRLKEVLGHNPLEVRRPTFLAAAESHMGMMLHVVYTSRI